MIGVPGYADRPKGGWRRHDAAAMVKVLFWRRCANLGDERTGFQPGEPAPDQKTVCLLRDKRTRAGALKALVCGFRRAVAQPGLQAHRRPGSGRPADRGPATTDDRGRESPRQGRWEWPGHLAGGSGQGAARKDTDARWTVKYSRARKTRTARTMLVPSPSRFPVWAAGTLSPSTANGALSEARPAHMASPGHSFGRPIFHARRHATACLASKIRK